MKRVVLPQPPDAARYSDMKSWASAASVWMQQAKQMLDDANRVNASPIGQQFVSTDFSTNTTVTGTTTGTDLSNVVASIVAAFTSAGYISPVQKRTST